MLSKRILTVCCLFACIIACSKKDSETPPPDPPINKEIKAIQDFLSTIPDFSAFASSSITRNFNPAIRYSEVLLMNSEGHAKFLENDMTGINMVRARRRVLEIRTRINNYK